jgi:diguanylate cyclase (GGDEF)-like protein
VRLIRLIAVFLGVGLVVAVSAGYVARSAEHSRDRDLWVETASELAAKQLDTASTAVEVAAGSSGDASRAATVLAEVGLDACAAPVTGGGAVVCSGADDRLATLRDALTAAGDIASDSDAVSTVDVVDGNFVVVRRGADVIVAASTATDDLARSARVSAATVGSVTLAVVPTSDAVSGIDGAARTVGELRESARPLTGAPGWSVVASLPDEVAFDSAERTLLMVLLVLAVLLLGLAGFTLVAERRHLVERASLDPLTRLPNRGEFERRGEALVQTAQRAGEGVCLMLVDLDGFKDINDTHGHQAGDEVLKVIGMRLRNAVRGYDLVARWGGDEFVLVLQGIDNDVLASTRARGLASLVAERLRADDADGVGLQVGASVGIALLGQHGDDLGELVEAADAAMYAAKRAGEAYRLAEPRGSADAYAEPGATHPV